ncbi:hypothetical protein G7Y89_g15798 [Cudoniella acicularis]|uniref:DUF6594 domain-containing protein n=1 Tax=Cudoniella acicularis TaxID=354080 RepID=A0A8H4VJ75_9HELO|nr:hypothetical protein G7Y89_g15798 [Cudoniella acicularis]
MVQNDPSSPAQRSAIINRRGVVDVRADLFDAVHGHHLPDGEFATLVVLRFRFDSRRRGRRVMSAKISVLFADIDADAKFDPEVSAVEPEGVFVSDVFTLIGSKKEEGRSWGSPNVVWWTMDEDPTQKGGIASTFQTAILLKRQSMRQFTATVKLEVSVAATILDKFRIRVPGPHKPADDQVIFDPSLLPTNNLRVYEADKLSTLPLKELSVITLNSYFQGGEHGAPQSYSFRSFNLPIPQVREGSTNIQRLYDCARGLHPLVWYQFKRFETLSLFNLYNYQHELVMLQKKIDEAKGEAEHADVLELRKLLREYSKAVKSFKEISQLDRPPGKAGRDTVDFLGTKLGETYYFTAGDASSMIDLTPSTNGDPVRIFVQKRIATDSQSLRSNHSTSEQTPVRLPEYVQEWVPPKSLAERRPHAPRISPAVDKMTRLGVAIVGGAFLLAPMSALTFIREPKYQLVTVVLFVLVFAVTIALGILISEGFLNGSHQAPAKAKAEYLRLYARW